MLKFQSMVALSGSIAFAINLSIYWIIGNTSALTYPYCTQSGGAHAANTDCVASVNHLIGTTHFVRGAQLWSYFAIDLGAIA